MKRILFILIFIFLPFSAMAEDGLPFLSVEDLPDIVQIIPAPPEFDNPRFAYDKVQYEWGKSLRETPRGEQAIADARANMHSVVKVFSEPMGISITEKGTPKIYTLLDRTVDTVMISIKVGKKHYQRMRPYVFFHEPSLLPSEEKSHNPKASFPSGHSSIGWTTALVLAEINPKAQDALLRRGYEFGQSRVIAGYHFQTDVDAARLISSIVVNRLHSDDEFMNLLKEAKQEFDIKSKRPSSSLTSSAVSKSH